MQLIANFSALLATVVMLGSNVTPSVVVDPDQTSATADWSITIPAQYCGGYRIGDGVYISPEAPITLPSPVPDGSVMFAGQPAEVDEINGAWRVSLAPGIAQSMICMPDDRPLTIELTPQAGVTLPDSPGTYAVDVWTGANPTPMTLQFDVPADADSQS
jgi:hypothetical protein